MRPVVVAGTGIVGASAAYHLAAAGGPVTLLDRFADAGGRVTGASPAWIGDAGGDWPGGADDLRRFVRAARLRRGRVSRLTHGCVRARAASGWMDRW